MALTMEIIRGRVSDLDAHEQIAYDDWPTVFGERGKRFLRAAAPTIEMMRKRGGDENNSGTARPDDAEITEKTVWEKKGTLAPSHADMSRRPAVMDMMGIQRQLVFPTMALMALSQALGGLHVASDADEKVAAWDAIDAYNDWAAALTSQNPGRLYVAALLKSAKPGMTAEQMTKDAGALIKMGAKAVFVPTGLPPAGLVPHDKALDPFYATLAEANVALVSHPPGGVGYHSAAWKSGMLNRIRMHQAEENFVASLVFNGVFERHPTLRFGIIETGASWVGPLADYLDFWANEERHPLNAGAVHDYHLPMKPSEYIARNMRATPYNFEPVEVWFERYPHLQDVYCYSSDFPHREGQTWSLKKFYDNVAPLGQKITEKFFCTNGQLLLD